MSTYTDLHNRVKENIVVGYNPEDRVSIQKVKLYNEENEYWGTFKGSMIADDITIHNGVLTDVSVINSTLCCSVLKNRDGSSVDLETLANDVQEMSVMTYQTVPTLSARIDTLSTMMLSGISADVDILSAALSAEISAVSADCQFLSSEISSAVQRDHKDISYFGNLEHVDDHEDHHLSCFLRKQSRWYEQDDYKFKYGFMYRLSADQGNLIDATGKNVFLGDNDYIIFNKEVVLSNVIFDDMDMIRDAKNEVLSVQDWICDNFVALSGGNEIAGENKFTGKLSAEQLTANVLSAPAAYVAQLSGTHFEFTNGKIHDLDVTGKLTVHEQETEADVSRLSAQTAIIQSAEISTETVLSATFTDADVSDLSAAKAIVTQLTAQSMSNVKIADRDKTLDEILTLSVNTLTGEINAVSSTITADVKAVSTDISTAVSMLSDGISADVNKLSSDLSTDVVALSTSLSNTVKLSVEQALAAAVSHANEISSSISGTVDSNRASDKRELSSTLSSYADSLTQSLSTSLSTTVKNAGYALYNDFGFSYDSNNHKIVLTLKDQLGRTNQLSVETSDFIKNRIIDHIDIVEISGIKYMRIFWKNSTGADEHIDIELSKLAQVYSPGTGISITLDGSSYKISVTDYVATAASVTELDTRVGAAETAVAGMQSSLTDVRGTVNYLSSGNGPIPTLISQYELLKTGLETHTEAIQSIRATDEYQNEHLEILDNKLEKISLSVVNVSSWISADMIALSTALSNEVISLSTDLSNEIISLSTSLSTQVSVLSDSISADIIALSTALSNEVSAHQNTVQKVSKYTDLVDGKNTGDVGIVSAQIGTTDKYECTTYVWSSELTAWNAIDGNHSADSIIMPSNMRITKQFGKYDIPAVGYRDLTCAGMTVNSFINDAFSEKVSASKVNPTATFTGPADIASTNKEAGEYATSLSGLVFKYTADGYYSTFNDGLKALNTCKLSSVYLERKALAEEDLGDPEHNVFNLTAVNAVVSAESTVIDDVAVGGLVVLAAEESSEISVQYTDSDIMLAEYRASASWLRGTAVPKNNIGEDDPDNQIAAGDWKYNNSTWHQIGIKAGNRKRFWYVGTDSSTPADSVFMRTAGNGHGSDFSSTAKTISLSIPAGTKRAIYAVMSNTATLKSVIDVDGMGLDIKDKFTTTHDVDITGANGFTAKKYTLFTFVNENGAAKTTFNITLN